MLRSYLKARRISNAPLKVAPAPAFEAGDAVRIHLGLIADACPLATPATVVERIGDAYLLDVEGEPEPMLWHGELSAA